MAKPDPVNDFKVFCRIIRIYDAQTSNAVLPYVPRWEQADLISRLRPGARVVVAKGRRVGITTALQIYSLWLIWREQHGQKRPIKVILCAETQAKANSRLQDIRDIASRLPDRTKIRWAVDQAGRLVTPCGASIVAMGTGGTAADVGARGEGAVFVHLTEFDYYASPEATIAANEAVVGKHGCMVVETTVRAPGGYYQDLVTQAESGTGAWELAWYPWWKHAEYVSDPVDPTEEEIALLSTTPLDPAEYPVRAAWWRQKRASLPSRDSMGREYPTTTDDAFRMSDGVFFDSALFDGIERLSVSGPVASWSDRSYKTCLGMDIGKGTGGDSTVITVLDAGNLDPLYLWASNRVDTFAAAKHVAEIAPRYRSPLSVIETNSIGEAVWLKVKELGVPNLWMHPDTGKPWTTTASTKDLLYEHLRGLLTRGRIAKMPAPTVTQLRSLVSDGGAPSAPPGKHDDHAVSYALACWAAKYVSLPANDDEMHRMLRRMQAHRMSGMISPWG